MNNRKTLFAIIGIAGIGALIATGCAISVAQQQPAPKGGQGQAGKGPGKKGQGKKAQGQAGKAAPGGKAAAGKPAGGQKPIARVKPLAGVPIKAVTDQSVVSKMIPRGPFEARNDPFALLPIEAAYDKYAMAQTFARRNPSFPIFYRAQPERVVPVQIEQQPYRRLAAIMIGESISALIDMGDGKGLIRVRPGQRIQGTEWVVDSIDNEKAILTRIPESTKRPTEVIVRLESPPRNVVGSGGLESAPGGAPGGQPGRTGGGAPARRGGRIGAGGGGGNPD